MVILADHVGHLQAAHWSKLRSSELLDVLWSEGVDINVLHVNYIVHLIDWFLSHERVLYFNLFTNQG